MIDSRTSIASGLDDVLARIVTLAVATTRRVANGDVSAIAAGRRPRLAPNAGAIRYLSALARRAIAEAARRRKYRFAHWRVGYRTATDGAWHELHEQGDRFFADPFPYVHDGRQYIFVEDYDHAIRRAAISVVELDSDGRPGAPRKIIEEPTHLSYPQVFAHDDQIWMIPENSGAREVVLYRAESFPDRWVRHAVLIADAEISDATLLHRGADYWLFGTLRDGHGSTSDTMVVYHAPALTGPWTPHVANPIVIDRRRARPAGGFIEHGDRTYLPVQDGTDGYGGGMGLSELIELTPTRVRLSDPVPFGVAGGSGHRVHTYNRMGDLEAIDWIVDMPVHLSGPLETAPTTDETSSRQTSTVNA